MPSLRVTETDILRVVRDYLRVTGWSVWRHQAGLGAPRGFPDLVAIRRGEVLFVEVKTPKGRLSEHQVAFRAEVQAQGGRYAVVRGLEDIREVAGR